MVARDSSTLSHRVGPFDIETGTDELVLRLENRGEFPLAGCALLGFTMAAILLTGVMSILHVHQVSPNFATIDQPNQVFAPQQNHFGFLWLVSSLAMLVLLPLYVIRTYGSALTFTFRKSEDVFLKGRTRVTRLKRIEYLRIHEARDPDRRYLYTLHLVYNDGMQMLIHNGYDEREIMNLANEISSFVCCPVKWK